MALFGKFGNIFRKRLFIHQIIKNLVNDVFLYLKQNFWLDLARTLVRALKTSKDTRFAFLTILKCIYFIYRKYQIIVLKKQ